MSEKAPLQWHHDGHDGLFYRCGDIDPQLARLERELAEARALLDEVAQCGCTDFCDDEDLGCGQCLECRAIAWLAKSALPGAKEGKDE